MRTLAQVEAKIVQLQAEAEQLRKSERAGVVTRIREAMISYQISFDELQIALAAPERKPGRGFTDGVQVWSGKGKQPGWLTKFLDGRPLETARTMEDA